jgi:hypothetical protein
LYRLQGLLIKDNIAEKYDFILDSCSIRTLWGFNFLMGILKGEIFEKGLLNFSSKIAKSKDKISE